jgi:hypothetical protein
MTAYSSTGALGTDLNPFLFASISDDADAPLSVVSALARLDIDPWQEAEELRHLQRGAAARRLAALLARAPGASEDLPGLVARLVALLPGHAATPRPAITVPHGRDIKRDAVMMILLCVAAVALTMLSLQTVDGRAAGASTDHRTVSSPVSGAPSNPDAPR